MRESTYKTANDTKAQEATGAASYGRTVQAGTEITCRHWDSVEELVSMSMPTMNAARFDESVLSGGSRGERWWGHSHGGFSRVLEQVAEGDSELYQKLRGMVAKIMPEMTPAASLQTRKRRKRTSDDYGMSIDMDRVNQGNLDRAWTRMERVQKSSVTNRSVAVFINMGISGYTSANDAIWRAACAIATTDYLMQRGYNVKVYVGHKSRGCYQDGNAHYVFSVKVKDYQSHISPELMAVACSVGFFRGLGFKMILADGTQRVDSGLGLPLNDKSILPEDFMKDKECGALVVDIDNQATSQGGAARTFAAIKAQIESRETAAH